MMLSVRGFFPAEIKKNGGEPYICRTGHSFIKEMMLSKNAQLGGEMSGHIFLKIDGTDLMMQFMPELEC